MWMMIVAAGLYSAISALIWRRIAVDERRFARRAISWGGLHALTAVACGLHGWQLYRNIVGVDVFNLALGHFVSLVAWMGVVLYWCVALYSRRIARVAGAPSTAIPSLGVIVLPLGLLGLLIGELAPGNVFLLDEFVRGIGRHLIIAVAAYAVLSIAFAQALLLWLQEKQLRQPRPSGFFAALPALQTMETTLFRLTLLGFVLLSVNLITGIRAVLENYDAFLLFNHHILFALLAWGGFGALLSGRAIFGWRGQTAAKWTMAAFGLLVLAYFGARFVGGVLLAG